MTYTLASVLKGPIYSVVPKDFMEMFAGVLNDPF